jgi:hypothetical protein
VHVEWDSGGLVTPLGQLPFFIEYLKQAGLFAGWVADCPLRSSSPNAPPKRDLLGTLLLSALSAALPPTGNRSAILRPTMSDYDADILTWSERQAELLRRRAAGKRVDDAEVDWPNIAEEIESVGRSELHAVESLQHKLRAEVWPLSPEAPLWRAEAWRFRDETPPAGCPPCTSGST